MVKYKRAVLCSFPGLFLTFAVCFVFSVLVYKGLLPAEKISVFSVISCFLGSVLTAFLTLSKKCALSELFVSEGGFMLLLLVIGMFLNSGFLFQSLLVNVLATALGAVAAVFITVLSAKR